MSYKFIVFGWVPDFINEQIKELVTDNPTREHLKDLAESMDYEIKDMNFQLRTRGIQAKLDEQLESEEYLRWKERVISRLRIKSSIYGTILYNLRKYKEVEAGVLEKRLEKLEKSLNYFTEQNNLRFENINKRFEGEKNEREKEHASVKKNLNDKFQKMHDEFQRQRSFFLRCLYHLLTVDGMRTDEESLYLTGCLSFIPPVMEKSTEFGKFPE